MSLRDLDIDITIQADLATLNRLNSEMTEVMNTARRMGSALNTAFSNSSTSAKNYLRVLQQIHSQQQANGNMPAAAMPSMPIGASSPWSPHGANVPPTGAVTPVPPVINNAQNQMARGAMALAVGAGLKSAGSMIVGAFASATTAGMEFEKQMDKVSVLAGATTPKEMKRLSDTAIQLGADTTKSASEVAISMTELGAKGFDTNKIIAAMPGIIGAAEASGEDLALTSDVVTSALNAFQMKGKGASKVADVLSMAANKSAAGIGDMGYAFKYAAPIFKTAGLSMEELAAATGILRDKGLEGSQIGTSLRMGFLRLSAEPKAAKKEMDKLGFSATDANDKFKSLDVMTKELSDSMEGMSAKDKLESVKNIFGVESASAWLQLINAAPGELKNLTKELENSGGTAEKSAKLMMDNAAGGLETFRGNIESFQISLYKAFEGPLKTVLFAFAGGIGKITDAFNKLTPGAKLALLVFTVTVGVLSAIAGAALIAWGGFMLLTAGLGITTGALWALIWPIAAVIAAIALIAAGIVYMWNQHAWFRDGVIAAWNAIKAAAVGVWSAIVAAVTPAITAVVTFVKSQLDLLKQFWSENGTQIVNVFRVFWASIVAAATIYFAVLSAVFSSGWAIIKGVVQVAWAGIKILISSALILITGVIKTALAVMRGDWEGAKEAISGTVRALGENIYNILKSIDLKQIGIDMMTGLANGITGAIDKVVGAAKSAWSAVKGAFGSGSVKSPGAGNTPTANGAAPGFATGLANVPYDNFNANLHAGEAVLTAQQANQLRSMGMLTANGNGTPNLNMDGNYANYSPERTSVSQSNGPSRGDINFAPVIQVTVADGDKKTVKQQMKEVMEETFDLWNTLYSVEEVY